VRIKVVVQRYGADLLGGAERHAALMAGILARHHDVEVLTTTAGDYHTWSAAYPEGTSDVDGVRVHRFAVEQGRTAGWSVVSGLLHEGFDPSRFALLSDRERDAFATRVRAWPDALQEDFIRGQGPVAPGITAALERGDFDRALFVTYLYPTTYDGLLAVDPSRARVVPTLHDEPPAYLPAFGRRLRRATLLCSTDAEIRLAHRLYGNPPEARRLGYGIDLPVDEPGPADERSPFLLYAGRIDTQKGIRELLSWYDALCELEPSPPRLVLIGDGSMPLPDRPGLEPRGFVSEAEKIDLMRRALAFVHPSPFESLGIVLLESLAVRTPILVNARSEVMVDHCRASNAGLWVSDGAQFAAAVRRLRASPELRRDLGANGRAYVEETYSMDAYERQLLIEFPR